MILSLIILGVEAKASWMLIIFKIFMDVSLELLTIKINKSIGVVIYYPITVKKSASRMEFFCHLLQRTLSLFKRI